MPVTGHAVEHRFVRPDNPFDHALVELPPTGRDHADLFAALWTFDIVDGQGTDDHPGGCHVVMWIRAVATDSATTNLRAVLSPR